MSPILSRTAISKNGVVHQIFGTSGLIETSAVLAQIMKVAQRFLCCARVTIKISKEVFEDESKQLLYSIEVMNERIKFHDYSPVVIGDIRKEINKLRNDI